MPSWLGGDDEAESSTEPSAPVGSAAPAPASPSATASPTPAYAPASSAQRATALQTRAYSGQTYQPAQRSGRTIRPNFDRREPAAPLPPTETEADRQLERIYQRQQEVYADLRQRQADISAVEQDRLLNDVLNQYQAFVSANPENVYGHILYGKMLRDVGEPRAANALFVQADQLAPGTPVVKQQLANYLAETGDYQLALPLLVEAAELAPNEAVYQYQVGELLHQYSAEFINNGELRREVLERNMLRAFERAAALEPANREYRERYALAFFDVLQPDWSEALRQWNLLRDTADSDLERDLIALNRARVLMSMNRPNDARQLLQSINRPAIEQDKQRLLRQL